MSEDKIKTIDNKTIVSVKFSGAYLIELKILLFKLSSELPKEELAELYKTINEPKDDNLKHSNIKVLFDIINSIEEQIELNNLFIEKSVDDFKKEMNIS